MAPDLRTELAALHPEAHAWAVRCCRGDRPEAEDVLQQAYLKVLDGRARYDGRSAFRTWLYGVIRLTARERWRTRWLRRGLLERWWRERDGVSLPPPGAGEDDERIAALRGALARLSGRQQEVLHLVFYQELTIREAAEVLDLPVGTARTHYERGKARLRGLLDGRTGT
jgi:RNA polymerase sigma factor (sigma-70 family)